MKVKNIKNIKGETEEFSKTLKDSLFKRAVGGNVLEETSDFELKNKGKMVFCKKQNAVITPYGILYGFRKDNAKFKFSKDMSLEKLKKMCVSCDGVGFKCELDMEKSENVRGGVGGKVLKAGDKGGKTTKGSGENNEKGVNELKKINLEGIKTIDNGGVQKKSKQKSLGVYFCEDVKDKLMSEKMVCVKKKVSKKYAPPDTQAVKMLIEMNEGTQNDLLGITSELDSLNNEQLEKMKKDLIKRILD